MTLGAILAVTPSSLPSWIAVAISPLVAAGIAVIGFSARKINQQAEQRHQQMRESMSGLTSSINSLAERVSHLEGAAGVTPPQRRPRLR